LGGEFVDFPDMWRLARVACTLESDRIGSGRGAAVAEVVNPYTLVPLVSDVQRGELRGHEGVAGDGLCGVLDMEWMAVSPLLIGGYESAASGGELSVGLGIEVGQSSAPAWPVNLWPTIWDREQDSLIVPHLDLGQAAVDRHRRG
jgi:hypothetical protein